jgi:hypothetical protein
MTLGLGDLAFLGGLGGITDPDAAAYILAVEAADGQALEADVRSAIEAFIVGCKTDGIWSAIKASCIMAGARTLAGALVPLVGPAPTNLNFGAGDYDRKTGLVGNGSTKYLDSNRNNNADPQDSRHIAIYVDTLASNNNVVLLGASNIVGRTSIVRSTGIYTARMTSNIAPPGVAGAPGFLGGVRTSSSSSSIRSEGVTTDASVASQVPASESLGVFANGLGGTPAACRLSYYSIGESLDLALLDARITALINAFGAAIP